MPRSVICVAKFCMSGPNYGDDTSFVNLPKDKTCCQNWLRGVGRKDLCKFSSQDLHKAGFRMCMKHFKSSDIHVKETTGELYVKKRAIPTQEENSSPLSKKRKTNRTAPKMKYVLQEVPVELDANENEDDENNDENENEDDESIPVVVEDSPLKPVPLIVYCTVPLCSNNSKQHPHLAFHQIPTQNGTSKKSQILHQKWRSWLEQLYSLWDIDYKFISNEVLVCSEHFSPGVFSSRPVRGVCAENVKLACHAYPTVDPLYRSFKSVREEQIRLLQESHRKTNENSVFMRHRRSRQPVPNSEIGIDVTADKLDRSNEALEEINKFLRSSEFSSFVASETNLCKQPNASKTMHSLNEESSTSNESNYQMFVDENLSVPSSSQCSSAVESETNLCKQPSSSKIMLNLNEDSSTSNESNNQMFADENLPVTHFLSSINNLEAQSQTSTSSEDSCFMTYSTVDQAASVQSKKINNDENDSVLAATSDVTASTNSDATSSTSQIVTVTFDGDLVYSS